MQLYTKKIRHTIMRQLWTKVSLSHSIFIYCAFTLLPSKQSTYIILRGPTTGADRQPYVCSIHKIYICNIFYISYWVQWFPNFLAHNISYNSFFSEHPAKKIKVLDFFAEPLKDAQRVIGIFKTSHEKPCNRELLSMSVHKITII